VKELSGNNAEGQTEWRDVDDAIRAVVVLEGRASVDDSQSTLLSAVAERTKQRNRAKSVSQEAAEKERKRLTDRIDLVTANLKETLRIKAQQVAVDGTNAKPAHSDRTSGFLPNSDAGATNNVVFLVHGIRTHGQWFRAVRRVIEASPCQVIDIKFGYWNVIRFLIPGRRKFPITKVAAEIRQAKVQFPGARLFAIAHSFGTYVLVNALEDPTFEMTRVILCGSIVPENFVPQRYFFASGGIRIINDCGVRDIWPVLAKCTTWGYGATGTFGMGTSSVKDRYFNFTHGDFFAPEFVAKYWMPFINEGIVIQSPIADDDVPSPWYFEKLNSSIWRWIIWGIPVTALAIIAVRSVGKLSPVPFFL
jgi:hypothetical protein